LGADLNATEFLDLPVPLVNNWQARLIHTGTEAREGLFQQVPNPVRWTETIQTLVSNGAARFIEVGAGNVLMGLLRNINPDLQGARFGEAEDLEKVHAANA